MTAALLGSPASSLWEMFGINLIFDPEDKFSLDEMSLGKHSPCAASLCELTRLTKVDVNVMSGNDSYLDMQ